MDILNCIPTGHKNAVTREQLGNIMRCGDRKVREIIAAVNKSEDDGILIINMQDGRGYFRPTADEDNLVRIWKAQERHRGASVVESVYAADRYLARSRRKAKKPVNELERNQISMFEFMGGG